MGDKPKVITRAALKPPTRKIGVLNVQLDRDTVRKAEKIMERTGETLNQFVTRALVTLKGKPSPAEMLPIYFPADDVRIFREICEAGGCESGDDMIRDVIGSMADESLLSDSGNKRHLIYGVLDAVFHGDLEGGEPFEVNAAIDAMQAVVDRWNAKGRSAA